jgi:mycothiol synthase
LLTARGYRGAGPGGVRMRRSLASALADPVLPADMQLRDGNEVDLGERASAHRDAWTHLEHIGIASARSVFSTRVYERLRRAPMYDPALDLAVQTATGTIASCCICWIDDRSMVGTFEPVGTREAFRGQGLARALVMKGLRRLQEMGVHTALIGTASFNRPAQSVYQACGFEHFDREQRYVTTIAR